MNKPKASSRLSAIMASPELPTVYITICEGCKAIHYRCRCGEYGQRPEFRTHEVNGTVVVGVALWYALDEFLREGWINVSLNSDDEGYMRPSDIYDAQGHMYAVIDTYCEAYINVGIEGVIHLWQDAYCEDTPLAFADMMNNMRMFDSVVNYFEDAAVRITSARDFSSEVVDLDDEGILPGFLLADRAEDRLFNVTWEDINNTRLYRFINLGPNFNNELAVTPLWKD